MSAPRTAAGRSLPMMGQFNGEGLTHYLRSEDIRWSLCGIWVGSGFWSWSDTVAHPYSLCDECVAILAAEPEAQP